MNVKCMLCAGKFDIDSTDPQYRKLVRKETKFYICKSCNNSTKRESIKSSGINPTEIDKYEKL